LDYISTTHRSPKDDRILAYHPLQDVADYTAAKIDRIFTKVREAHEETPSVQEPITIGGISIDVERMSLIVDGNVAPIVPQQLRLLIYMMRHADQLVTRATVMQLIKHGDEFEEYYSNIISAQVSYMRKALGRYKDHIETVREAGYRFVSNPEPKP